MPSSRIAVCILVLAFFSIGAGGKTVAQSYHARRRHGIYERVHQRDSLPESPLYNFSSLVEKLEPGMLAAKLPPNVLVDNDPVYVMFTGDPQYHFPCANENLECKKQSQTCRKEARDKTLAEFLLGEEKITLGKLTMEVMSLVDRCAIIESTFANAVQRRAIFGLNRRLMEANVALVALIINGDLTNYGHSSQLKLFQNEWLSLPIPVFAGLGNHDYEINVDDCSNNQCANRMLSWFVNDYAPKLSLTLDHTESNVLWQSRHQGSLAYSVNFCSRSGSNCVHSIQLNNRADYGRRIDAFDTVWDIRPSLGWLAAHLESSDVINDTWPVIINVHDNERNGSSASRLNRVIEQWLQRPENRHHIRRVMVLFAHWHNRHELYTQCIAGVRIPFIYVGSVPYNRYTIIKYSGDVASVFFLRANVDSTSTIMKLHECRWASC